MTAVILPETKRLPFELPSLRERMNFAFELGLLLLRNKELAISYATHLYCTPKGRRGESVAADIYRDACNFVGPDLSTTLPDVGEIEKLLSSCKMGNLEVDGERIRCYLWMRSKGSKAPVVVFAHGWESYGLSAYPMIRAFIRAGWQVVTFDQRSHGASSGHHAALPEFSRTLRTVVEKVGNVDLIVGHCLGATAALAGISREQISVKKLALISPHSDAVSYTYDFAKTWFVPEKVRRGMLSNIEASFRMEYRHVVPEIVGPKLHLPMAAFHDPDDKFIPYRYTQRLARYAEGMALHETHGIGHFGGLVAPQVIEQVLRFADPRITDHDDNAGARESTLARRHPFSKSRKAA
jgi:pimeloyl-ACP methyl ester carboxylesterase